MARVDERFALESFEFSLDPGTGATVVRGSVSRDPNVLKIAITSGGGTRTEVAAAGLKHL
jgi:hypothetical protein